MENVFTFKGISEIETCDCCGRQGLKRTVALEMFGTDEIVFYGVDCAAKAMKYKIGGKTVSQTNKAVLQAFINEQIKIYNNALFEILDLRRPKNEQEGMFAIEQVKAACEKNGLSLKEALTGVINGRKEMNSFFLFNYQPEWYVKFLSSI